MQKQNIVHHTQTADLYVLLDACWIDGLGKTRNTSLVKPSQNDLCWSPPQSTSNWDDTFIFQHRFLFLRPASATGLAYNAACWPQWHDFIFLFSFFLLNFLVDFMWGWSWTPVSFLLHVKYTVSYRIVSHGRVTSVVRATPLVNGRGQIYPSHQTHALNRQSPNFAHVFMSTISADMQNAAVYC